MSKRVLRTESELVAYLRALREQDETAAVVPPAASPAAPASPAPDPAAPAVAPVTVDDIIERLNIVRAGRSTRDADVKRELDEYIAQFNEDEKTALLAFLEGLGQILTSGVDSTAAADPQDPYALQIKKLLGAATASATPTPQKAPTSAPAAPVSGPVPIKVGGV